MTSRRLVSASALNLLDYAIRFGAVLAVSPFLIRTLGKEQYGLWILLLSLVGYLNLVDLGMASTAVRYFSAARGRDDPAEIRARYRFFRSLYLWLSLAALALAVVGAAAVPWFTRDPATVAEARFVLLLGGGVTGGAFFIRVYGALLKSHLLYHRLVVAGLARFVLFTLGIFLVIPEAPGIRTMALLWVGTALLEQALIYFQARSLVPTGRGPAPLRRDQKREMLAFAGKNLSNIGSKMLRGNLDTVIIGGLVSVTSVTHYAMGSRFLAMFHDLVNAVFGGHFLAAFAFSQARDDAEESRRKLFRALRISVPLAVSGGAALLVLGPPFIDRWLGPGFEESHTVIRWLALPYALMLMQYPVGPWAAAHDRHGRFAAAALVGGLANAAASILMVLAIGFPGVVVATAAEMTLLYLLVWPWLLWRYSGVPPAAYASALLAPALRLLPGAALFVLAVYLFPPLTWPGLVGQGALAALFFFGSTWWLVFDRSERRQLLAACGLGR